MFKAFLVLLLLLTGCTSNAPLLVPTSKGQSVSTGKAIRVIVKPIATQGIGSEDEKRLGMNFSAYFTAFEVTLVNQTEEVLSFSPLTTHIMIGSDQRKNPLNEAESIQYYTEGDDPSRIVLIPKSKKKIKKEVNTIKQSRLIGGTIQPGQQKKGLILFKKVSQKRCRDVVLSLEGISVVRTGEKKRFSFPFSCKTEN